ncbi:MAG: hypothetical protein JWQ94_1544 [Tardiphaga sp.]|nr:hypothetical protein [Tardiphaga sp.]
MMYFDYANSPLFDPDLSAKTFWPNAMGYRSSFHDWTGRVPLYYYSITKGNRATVFCEGVDLADDTAAWHEARVCCGKLLRNSEGSVAPGEEWRLEVTDAARTLVFTLCLFSEVHR